MKIVYLSAGPGIDIRPDVDGERVRRRLNLAGRFAAALLSRAHDSGLRARLGTAACVEAEHHSWSEHARIVAELAGALSRPRCPMVPGRVQMSTARPVRG